MASAHPSRNTKNRADIIYSNSEHHRNRRAFHLRSFKRKILRNKKEESLFADHHHRIVLSHYSSSPHRHWLEIHFGYQHIHVNSDRNTLQRYLHPFHRRKNNHAQNMWSIRCFSRRHFDHLQRKFRLQQRRYHHRTRTHHISIRQFLFQKSPSPCFLKNPPLDTIFHRKCSTRHLLTNFRTSRKIFRNNTNQLAATHLLRNRRTRHRKKHQL